MSSRRRNLGQIENIIDRGFFPAWFNYDDDGVLSIDFCVNWRLPDQKIGPFVEVECDGNQAEELIGKMRSAWDETLEDMVRDSLENTQP